MVKVVISVGSNCGDRKDFVDRGLKWLKTLLIQPVCSDIYETPCARNADTPYMNAVIAGLFEGIGYDLDDRLKIKEHEMGRNAECMEKGDVPVDMDIVICDNQIYKPWDFRQKFFRIGYEEIME